METVGAHILYIHERERERETESQAWLLGIEYTATN